RWKSDGEWRRVAKNGDDVALDATIDLLDTAEARFVSRGGLKLAGALERQQISVAGLLCLDLGQSTGGFTDCLLQGGATHVVGVDVGSGQLNEVLRDDPRVTCIERVNARNMTLEDVLPALAESAAGVQFDGFDLMVGDLAFISQTLVLPAAVPMLKPGGQVLMLVKPQFELQPGQVGKGGIVTDASMFALVERRIRDAHRALGLQVQAYFASSIQGGDGNQEFFIHSIRAQE
ncbi:MAG TPA: TlyA family RNA methyltransferase, partial [Burkholderiaceae bacterium]|nr:TlyA family RNA methyltransferase [Burkholderiaceae bacterium]